MTTNSGAVPAFEVDSATFGYGPDPTLRDIDLVIDQREFVAVLGTNGSGKSTLMRGLLGLLPARSGQVRILGTPVADFRAWSSLAYVPQRLLTAGAVPVSVGEVVGTARVRGWGARMRRSDRDACQRALEAVGLPHAARLRFDGLSGGQQRRVMVAQALAKDARIFVLDEPTAGVDGEAQEQLARVFADLRVAGATVLLVTHELGVFSSLVTRAIVMHAGRHDGVAFDGPPPPPGHYEDAAWHHGAEIEPHDHQPGILEP